jgi:hypothetical protein
MKDSVTRYRIACISVKGRVNEVRRPRSKQRGNPARYD